MMPTTRLPPDSTVPRRGVRLALAVALAVFPVLACARSADPIEEAALLASKGQEHRAVAVLRSHLAEHPDRVPERRLLIRLLGSVGDLPTAEKEVSELAKRLPEGSPVPWIELGHVLELAHRYDEALAMYDRAAESAPTDAEGPRTGGLRAARWGESELAAPRLEEALRRDPRDAEVWHALGLVRAHIGDLDGARVAYQSGLSAVMDRSPFEGGVDRFRRAWQGPPWPRR
jgi:Flp pilus assembly protein TadD